MMILSLLLSKRWQYVHICKIRFIIKIKMTKNFGIKKLNFKYANGSKGKIFKTKQNKNDIKQVIPIIIFG